jgi:hypothetical protein
MRSVGHVAHVGGGGGCTGFWCGGLRERDNLEDQGIYTRKIIKKDLRVVRWGMDCFGLVGIGTGGVFLLMW